MGEKNHHSRIKARQDSTRRYTSDDEAGAGFGMDGIAGIASVGRRRLQLKLLCEPSSESSWNAAFRFPGKTAQGSRSLSMDRRLSRRTAARKRNWQVRNILPRPHEFLRTASQSVVLFGFPTTVQTSVGRLSLGTNLGSLPSDRRARQLPLPRDHIPQHHAAVLAFEVCRLRLARIWVPLSLRLHSEVLYGKA